MVHGHAYHIKKYALSHGTSYSKLSYTFKDLNLLSSWRSALMAYGSSIPTSTPRSSFPERGTCEVYLVYVKFMVSCV